MRQLWTTLRGGQAIRRRGRAPGASGDLRPLVLVAVVTLLVTACGGTGSGGAAAGTSPAASGRTFLGCLVTDTGGINDRSYNASAWQGMQAAAAADPHIQVRYLQSTTSSDYVPNIRAFETQHCGIIVTLSFLMAAATESAAKANPHQRFAIEDYTYSPALPNVVGAFYATNQDAFLGGYLAAAMSPSHVVGTFGGIDIPPVTLYMNGFVAGVRYYNLHNHAHVKVLGWNPAKNTGIFTGSFTDQNAGRLDAITLMNAGADVIFPVAGSVGLGAAAAVQAAGAPHTMEWVDTDGCISAPQYCGIFLTSVTKGVAVSVKAAVLSAAAGTFKGGTYTGTLANGGVALSPFHDFASKVPPSVAAALQTIKQGIEAGTISVNPASYPATS